MDNNNQNDGSQMNNIPYGNQQMNNTPYGNPQMNNTPYGNQQMNNTPYGNPQMNNTPYGNPQMNNTPYGNPQMNNTPYGNQQMNNMPYGNQQMRNAQYGGMQMGNSQSGKPPKNSTGIVILCICLGIALMAGIITAIVWNSRSKDDDSSSRVDHTVTENGTDATDKTDVAEATKDTTEATETKTDTEATDTAEGTEDADSTEGGDASEDTNNNGEYDKEGYVAVLDEYFECYSNHDMQGMIALYPPGIGDKAWDATLASIGTDSEEVYWQFMEMAYGEGFTVTYKLKTKTEVQRVEYTMLEASFTAAYGVDVKFDYAVKLTIDETCEGDVNSFTGTESLLMAVIDGKWYVMGSVY